jgi:hypothetical protein
VPTSGETRTSDQALSEREFEELLRNACEITGNQKTVQPLVQDPDQASESSAGKKDERQVSPPAAP